MGFHIFFTFTLLALKSTGFGGGHLQKEEKDSKGKETRGIGGKYGNGKQKLKTYFYKLFLLMKYIKNIHLTASLRDKLGPLETSKNTYNGVTII
jgi:hypothetical protein